MCSGHGSCLWPGICNCTNASCGEQCEQSGLVCDAVCPSGQYGKGKGAADGAVVQPVQATAPSVNDCNMTRNLIAVFFSYQCLLLAPFHLEAVSFSNMLQAISSCTLAFSFASALPLMRCSC